MKNNILLKNTHAGVTIFWYGVEMRHSSFIPRGSRESQWWAQISISLPRYLRVNTTDVGLHREMRIAHLLFSYIKLCLCQRLVLIHVLESLHRITFHFLSCKINLRSSEFLVNGQRQFKAGEINMRDKSYNFMYIHSVEVLTIPLTADKILIFYFFLNMNNFDRRNGAI